MNSHLPWPVRVLIAILVVWALSLLAALFRPNEVLEFLVPPSNREFGVLEISQLLVLATAIVQIACLALRAASRRTAVAGWLATVVLVVAFMEEIDYGLHLYDLARGNAPYTTQFFRSGARNIHNQGRLEVVQQFGQLAVLGAAVVLARRGLASTARWVLYGVLVMFALTAAGLFAPIWPDYMQSRVVAAQFSDEWMELGFFALIVVELQALIVAQGARQAGEVSSDSGRSGHSDASRGGTGVSEYQ